MAQEDLKDCYSAIKVFFNANTNYINSGASD